MPIYLINDLPTELTVFPGEYSYSTTITLVNTTEADVATRLYCAPKECSARRTHLPAIVAVLTRLFPAYCTQWISILRPKKKRNSY